MPYLNLFKRGHGSWSRGMKVEYGLNSIGGPRFTNRGNCTDMDGKYSDKSKAN